jgi:hypothetical protein
MSLRSAILVAGCGVTMCAVAVAWLRPGRMRNVSPDGDNGYKIRATLETVVPSHNDVSFRYVLENRSDRDYQLPDESDVKILGRNRSHGDLVPQTGEHVSGDFPLMVPAGRNVHFALVWTSDREVDPAEVSDVVKRLDLVSFVVIDKIRHYRIELPLGH